MKKLQNFLEMIFPNQYLIVDEWNEMDSEFDIFGIYIIPRHLRALGFQESTRALKSYSPDFVIFKNNERISFQYSKSTPGTMWDPPCSDYVEYSESYDNTERALIGIAKFLIDEYAIDLFFESDQ